MVVGPSSRYTDDVEWHMFRDIETLFTLTHEDLLKLTKAFLHEVRQGLTGYGHPMAMIPTFVTGVPDGSEKGTFLALDLGGTNLRVCQVTLNGDKTFALRQQKYKVSDALKTGEATALFDYLADSVDAFLTSNPPTDDQFDVVHLGLTFSFPVEQTALDSGKILTWTKGFSAKHAVGEDVVQLLQDAFDRKHMHVKCIALVNDTVGCLLARAYTGGGCVLGAIFGTGTNGAYVEQVSNITKLGNSPAAARGGIMVVNMEWGAFNNTRSHLPTTSFDNSIDRLSINPRFQAFEKFISGMYLGEITRNVLVALIDAAPRAVLFGGKATSVVNTQWGLDTSVMSDIEEAWEGKREVVEHGPDLEDVPSFHTFHGKDIPAEDQTRLERVRSVIVKSMRYAEADVSVKDAAIVRWVCTLVARRAARLSGVAVAAILIQTGQAQLQETEFRTTLLEGRSSEKIKVGVDGSLIEHYPNFERTLRGSLRALVGSAVEQKVEIGLAKDGSGVGAALCALQASKQLSESNPIKEKL